MPYHQRGPYLKQMVYYTIGTVLKFNIYHICNELPLSPFQPCMRVFYCQGLIACNNFYVAGAYAVLFIHFHTGCRRAVCCVQHSGNAEQMQAGLQGTVKVLMEGGGSREGRCTLIAWWRRRQRELGWSLSALCTPRVNQLPARHPTQLHGDNTV